MNSRELVSQIETTIAEISDRQTRLSSLISQLKDLLKCDYPKIINPDEKFGLYALCNNSNKNLIKIGKTSAGSKGLISQYNTRYSPDGYSLLCFWGNKFYYHMEQLILIELDQYRVKHEKTGRSTEWVNLDINTIEDVIQSKYEMATALFKSLSSTSDDEA